MSAVPITGHVDGLEGAYIAGWAISPTNTNCLISVRTPHGTELAAGRACHPRPDLAALGHAGRYDFAFRIQLPDLIGETALHVFADGTELPNSPIRVGRGVFDGHITLANGEISGWVTERVKGFAPPAITVLDQNGTEIFAGPSTTTPEATEHFAPAHFSGKLADACFGRGLIRATAYANGVKFAEAHTTLPLTGFLETITPRHVAGWLASPAAPARIFEIDIIRNGKHHTTTRTLLPRTDIHTLVPGATQGGFSVTLPEDSPPGQETLTLSFRLRGATTDLFEGPYLLAPMAAQVRAARQIAASARAGQAAPNTPLHAALLESALAVALSRARRQDQGSFTRQTAPLPPPTEPHLTLIIPIYRNVPLTQSCINAALQHRDPRHHHILLINDAAPEPEMAALLATYAAHPNLTLLTNETNLGYVATINRGLDFCTQGDVLLLNSDAELFAGGLAELLRVAHAAPDIGTVTAFSNNATIFSYPHPALRQPALADIAWPDLAAAALQANTGQWLDVPTGHGFCLLIKRSVLHRLGKLNEAFGRGYGEENEFCARAADLGFRNVAAPGAFVLHHESASFGPERHHLLARNQPLLDKLYPEYTATIMQAEQTEVLRQGRWPLDAARLRRYSEAGHSFALVIQHTLGGGTSRAIADIEQQVGYGDRQILRLTCRPDGYMQLEAPELILRAFFAPDETTCLLAVLSAANITLCAIHQLLGFPENFISRLGGWLAQRHAVIFLHDFYAICPRVTMIDATGQFCHLAPVDVCTRCIAMGGVHEASQLAALTPTDHRAMFAGLLAKATHVITPSDSAATYVRQAFPDLTVQPVPHPENPAPLPTAARQGNDTEITLFGAIGPHKGAATLVELARLARLQAPHLHFRIIGYTDRDETLRQLGNVTITGPYRQPDLPHLLSTAQGRLALFLSNWPETYSYTLSEAVSHGFIPLVPDIGAMAERVRATGFGLIFPFPANPGEILTLIAHLATNPPPLTTPAAFTPNPAHRTSLATLLTTPKNPPLPPFAGEGGARPVGLGG